MIQLVNLDDLRAVIAPLEAEISRLRDEVKRLSAGPISAATDPTDVYRYFGRKGKLLYVGISYDFIARDKQHAAEKHWYDDVKLAVVETFATRQLAMQAEFEAIRDEKPIHNSARGSFQFIPEAVRKQNACPLTGRLKGFTHAVFAPSTLFDPEDLPNEASVA